MELINSDVAAMVLEGGGAVDVEVNKKHRTIIYSMPNDDEGRPVFLSIDDNDEVSTKELERHINKIMGRTIH